MKPNYQESESEIKELESPSEQFAYNQDTFEIEEHEAVESKLLSSEKRSRTWLENSPVCTKIIDTDFNLQYMSHAGIQGLKIDDVQQYYGKPYPFHFFPEWSKKSMIENLEKVRETGEVITVETSALDLDGNELWFYSTLTPVNLEDGTLDYIMVVSTDITKRVEAEKKIHVKNLEIAEQNQKYEKLNDELQKLNAELTAAKEKAEESEKLKSSFLANMSHEIRTPLNSILGFTSLLKINKSLDEEEREEFFESIESGGNRLLRIISDIVDISKIDANQLSISNAECNLNKLINNLHNQLSIQLSNKDISFASTKELPDAESLILTDETRLAQILSNLIENAGKFTKEGSVEFGYTVEDSMLKFYVKDTGIGIDPKEQESIFERFRQSDNSYVRSGSGTGLGLPIAKELARLMEGQLWVESNKNEGATFYLTIPYRPVEQQVSDIIEEPDDLKEDQDVTILIAEDEDINFRYLKALFKDYGYTIVHAENGQEVVDIINSNSSVDLVLMDVRMPIMDGIEATKEIRKIAKTLPIIAQTAYVMPADKRIAFEAGINDYLEKPISKSKLAEIVQKHIKNEVED